MDNSPRFLITTADERSWRFDRPVLWLGAWCRMHGRSDAWDKLKGVIVPYHWDDREKVYRDYVHLRELYEVLLPELGEALNSVHGTRYSTRYWRILVGPWLLYFTQMLFDRWTMIQYAVRNYKIAGTAVLDLKPGNVIPKNMSEFRDMYPTDAWNHAIYGRILEGWTSVDCERIECDEHPAGWPAGESGGWDMTRKRVKRWTARAISRLLQQMNNSTDAFLISTYLPPRQNVLLQLALGQIPEPNPQIPAPQIAPDLQFRRRLCMNAEKHKDFEHCVRTMIPEHIPTVYLEGYRSLQSMIESLPWPKKPKVIFTSSSYNPDDVFKAWAGLRVDGGTPLVIGQHGGNLGSALWSSTEDHEIAIADRYLTWGWSDGNPKHYPVGALKQIGLKRGVGDRNGRILLVTSVMPRYSYVMGSFPIAVAQTEAELNDQYKFVRALPQDIYKHLLVRLFVPDWGWAQLDRWRDQFPDVLIDRGSGPIEPLIKKSRLYVATYNATTFLESLSRNIPTIMFWNPKHWELRPSAEPCFDMLRRAGIFHSRAEDAAAKVAEIWRDVQEWWNGAAVQKARQGFCDRYARNPESPLKELRKAITTVKSDRHYQQAGYSRD